MQRASGASCRAHRPTLDAGLLLLLFLIILAVGVAVLAPLREPASEQDDGARADRLVELELRKESKYAEIRDAEMDFQAGKLSRDDYRDIDRTLRAEAIAILEEIDRVNDVPPEGARASGTNG
jgi:flagellar biosynthesis/type III secretory pathway M-ring protein FliF/YscJ